MRVYMKAKSHTWGTKLFMLCSAHTAYFIRFEVYCCKKNHTSDNAPQAKKEEAATVVHNLRAVFGDAPLQAKMPVVIDRFYTLIALLIQLLRMGYYCVGTSLTNRVGYCKEVICKNKSRPKGVDRG
ncbi:hypothetical protein PC123_g15761 [Phytophthora cactorum]|nr:hypothetical protein PC123_g15761 [Phytophthora cactorum]